MPLPSLEKIIPVFDLTIPSTEAVLKFRPFLVKEEKLLLIALDGHDEKRMLEAVIQVVEACAISPIKVDELANFDLEYIFLQLRAKSVGERVELSYKCHNQVPLTPEDLERYNRRHIEGDPAPPLLKSCDHVVKIGLNLEDVEVQTTPGHIRTIFITDTIGLNMRYPNAAMAKKLIAKQPPRKTKDKDQEQEINIVDALTSIAMCVESVFDTESVHSQFQLKEITDWIEGLTQGQFTKLQDFFETMPKLAHDVDFLCPVCGYSEEIHIEGLPNFFG